MNNIPSKVSECEHVYVQWVYRECDDSMWDVTSCEACGNITHNVENPEYDYSGDEPGFNRETRSDKSE